MLIFIGETEKLKRDLGNLTNEEKAKLRDISHQQTLLEAEKKSVEELRADMADKQQKLGENRQQLLATTEELKRNADNIKQLSQQKVDLEKNIQVKQNDLKHYEMEHKAARIRAQAQENKVQGLRQNLEKLNLRDKQLFADVQHVEGKLESKKQEVKKHQKSVEQNNENIRNARERESKGQKTITEAKKQLSSIEQQIRQTGEKIAEHERLLHQASEVLRQANGKFDSNQQLKATNYKRLENIEKTITDLKVYHCEQQKQYEEKSVEIIKRELERREKIKANNTNTNTVSNEQVKRRS